VRADVAQQQTASAGEVGGEGRGGEGRGGEGGNACF
jgi:hypothetical protein